MLSSESTCAKGKLACCRKDSSTKRKLVNNIDLPWPEWAQGIKEGLVERKHRTRKVAFLDQSVRTAENVPRTVQRDKHGCLFASAVRARLAEKYTVGTAVPFGSDSCRASLAHRSRGVRRRNPMGKPAGHDSGRPDA